MTIRPGHRHPELPAATFRNDARASISLVDVAPSLDERLDAFRDAFESEVGDTMFVRARNLEREVGLRQLFLKFEGDNPSGTQKDRIAFAQVEDALRRGFDGITVATCGNYGVAVSFAARLAGLEVEVFVPERYKTRRIADMEALGARIRRAPGTYEEVVDVSRAFAESAGVYDANPGGANRDIQVAAYAQIAVEIFEALRDAPAVVALPVSNGTTLAGVHDGFANLYRRGKTSRMPQIVAGSTSGKNPIVRAIRRGFPDCRDLPIAMARETTVNEPLVNWRAIDGDDALYAIRNTRGWAGDVSDRRMRELARSLKHHQALHVLPASTAGLSALLEQHAAEPLPSDRYVAVLTGRSH